MSVTTSPILSFIWGLIPLVDPLFFSLLLMSAALWALVGSGILMYANNLNRRIKRTRQAIEEERWRQSLGQLSSNAGVLAFQIEAEDRWYAKPKGLLLIGLIVEVVGGLLVLLVGPLLSSS
jgi:hypothetical protein